jgi:hypothetical protein
VSLRSIATIAGILIMLPSTAAQAVGSCAGEADVYFNPPLTTSVQSGTGVLENHVSCVGPGGVVLREDSSYPFTYRGTCSAATMSYADWAALLVNGRLLVELNGTFLAAGAYVFTPDRDCYQASGHGYDIGAWE